MITVFGSINVDLTFPLDHLPSAGETVLTPQLTEAVGGKGANQAVAACRDGAATRFIGCVGSDDFGNTARRALQDAGVDVSGLTTQPGKTAVASIWIDDQGDNMIAVASGANAKLSADALAPANLDRESLLVLQMEVPRREIEAAIRHAKTTAARVLLNLAPALPLSSDALRDVDILVVNEHEAATLCQQFALTATSPDEQLTALADALAASVIITLGAAGVIARHEGAMLRADALPVTPVDTTGAGDCFVGVFAAALTSGLDFADALHRAAAAASLACTVIGAVPSFPTRAEIDAALATDTDAAET